MKVYTASIIEQDITNILIFSSEEKAKNYVRELMIFMLTHDVEKDICLTFFSEKEAKSWIRKLKLLITYDLEKDLFIKESEFLTMSFQEIEELCKAKNKLTFSYVINEVALDPYLDDTDNHQFVHSI